MRIAFLPICGRWKDYRTATKVDDHRRYESKGSRYWPHLLERPYPARFGITEFGHARAFEGQDQADEKDPHQALRPNSRGSIHGNCFMAVLSSRLSQSNAKLSRQAPVWPGALHPKSPSCIVPHENPRRPIGQPQDRKEQLSVPLDRRLRKAVERAAQS